MEQPKSLETVIWDEKKRKWETKIIEIEEHHGSTECRHCHKPISHNVKMNNEFKIVYVKCGCNR